MYLKALWPMKAPWRDGQKRSIFSFQARRKRYVNSNDLDLLGLFGNRVSSRIELIPANLS